MEFSDDKKAAFMLVKGVCDNIIKNPSAEHPEQLKHIFTIIDDRIIQEFVEYILYPIKLQIFDKNSVKRDDTVCILLNCLCMVLQHVTVYAESLFMDVYSIICYSLVKGQSQPGISVKGTSEELKLSAVNSVKILFLQSDESLLNSLYKKNEFYSKLCVIIYCTLQFAAKERSISLRVSSLECLLVVCRLSKMKVSESLNVNPDSAKFVKKCLPGIVTECRSIVSEGPTQNHQITVLALQLWSRSISLVMADCLNVQTTKSIQDLVGKFSTQTDLQEITARPDSEKDILKNADLNENWVKAAAKRLTSATDVFCMLKLHPHYKVRMELVSSVTHLLTYAPMNMNPSLSSLLDALIVLTEDADEKVSKASKRALETFKNGWRQNRGKLLLEDVKDCLCSLLTRLPRILHGSDDNLKESDMTLLCGYILLLGAENFTDFITSQNLLEKLVNCLLEAATLDASKISLIEESALRDIDERPYGEVPWRNLTVCSTLKLKSQLHKVFQILNSMPNLMDFAFALMENFNNCPLKRLEVTLCINDIVLSSEQIVDKKYSQIIKSIINEYLEPYFWDSKLESTLVESKKIVVQACLCSEGIGKLAKSLGPKLFSPFLFKCLFPLLEYAGSPYGSIAQAGLESVRIIAGVYGGDVSSLIKNNVDYLSHHITIKLKNVHKQVNVLYVLAAVMKNSNMETLPSLLEIVNNVLFQSRDKFQSKNLSCYFHVFNTFVSCLHSWIKNEKTVEIKSDKTLLEMLLEYQQLKKISEDYYDSDENSEQKNDSSQGDENPVNDDEQFDSVEEEKKTIPDHIKLTEAIMLRSAHFLPSKETQQQINIMQILDKGALILMEYPDNLLPVVHKIWGPLVERFEPNKDPLTVRYAFSLLCTLAHTSKDFIRQRSLKQILPKICFFLDKLSHESKLKPQLHGYRYTQKYKLQVEILEGLGQLALNIDLNGKDIYTLLKVSQPYLSSQQPQPLQDACNNLYLKLAILNRDMVWLHLISIWPQKEFLEPSAEFQIKYEIKINQDNHHYRKNVEKIINQISS